MLDMSTNPYAVSHDFQQPPSSSTEDAETNLVKDKIRRVAKDTIAVSPPFETEKLQEEKLKWALAKVKGKKVVVSETLQELHKCPIVTNRKNNKRRLGTPWGPEEAERLLKLYKTYGSKKKGKSNWAAISKEMGGVRTRTQCHGKYKILVSDEPTELTPLQYSYVKSLLQSGNYWGIRGTDWIQISHIFNARYGTKFTYTRMRMAYTRNHHIFEKMEAIPFTDSQSSNSVAITSEIAQSSTSIHSDSNPTKGST